MFGANVVYHNHFIMIISCHVKIFVVRDVNGCIFSSRSRLACAIGIIEFYYFHKLPGFGLVYFYLLVYIFNIPCLLLRIL
jgi:hypothetical protein